MEALHYTRLGSAIRGSELMREAIRLAADGELGNSDAIRLLQIPHCAEDVRAVLDKFETQLSSEAKSKLTLDALVPKPEGVDNQRFEPLFDKYLITGDTYTTASGLVVPNELQYYNGEMAHFYGECTNVAQVNEALSGSGYRALTLEYAGGRQTALAQLWSITFTDSSIGPYCAMFIVVAAVTTDTPAGIRADPTGASSVLAMLDGSFDAATRVYENKARLFMVRLLDTTRAAIEVGRERMGTDKRPGNVAMTRNGRRLQLSIDDHGGRAVVSGSVELSDDRAASLAQVTKAAATAGIQLRALPRGTEYSFPAVARIGRGPIVSWHWRTDLAPRLQPVAPNAIVFDVSSEEGRLLQAWGFRATMLGYIPNVRGVITGLAAGERAPGDADRVPEPSTRIPRRPVCAPDRVLPTDSPARCAADRPVVDGGGDAMNQPARDGSTLSWGTADTLPPSFAAAGEAVPFTVAVSPIRPGHVVTVEYRVDGGPLRQVTALPGPRVQGANGRLFCATIPGHSGGVVEFLPVLRLAGQPISPRLEECSAPLAYDVRVPPRPAGARSHTLESAVADGEPRWAWDTQFLGSLTAGLRKELVGVTPDGLRIDWHVTEGSFVGPGIDMVVLPGAADWMRIRQDGVGIVNVQVCLETRTGERVFGTYGGIFDLGPDGYARATRDDYDPLPPVVVTPTYATAVPRLEWLNRAQCVGVGRVDMAALRVQFDVYMVRVGGRAPATDNEERKPIAVSSTVPASLYQRIGGYDVLAPLAEDFIASIVANRQLSRFFVSGFTEARMKVIRQQVVEQLCQITGGSCLYTGRDMMTVHRGLGITDGDWTTAIDLLIAALKKHKIGPREQLEFVRLIDDMKQLIVERR